MTTHVPHETLLEACLARAARLETLIGYAPDSIVSKAVLDKHVGTVTLFAFDKGQKLSEHTSPYDAIVQVTEGRATVVIDGQPRVVAAGEIIIMPANVPHAVTADERFKMLLIMIRDEGRSV
ncbi:MAG: cupin [Planctomycetes bacterium RBG_13_62_9]|nr:MAG: cupin [Planctomycetes bacterium RBG_13_62_9]